MSIFRISAAPEGVPFIRGELPIQPEIFCCMFDFNLLGGSPLDAECFDTVHLEYSLPPISLTLDDDVIEVGFPIVYGDVIVS